MVSITIYIEGGTVDNMNDAGAQTVDNSSVFREGFYELFSQKFRDESLQLIVQPIGPVSQAKKYLKKLIDSEEKGAILIDLDGPKSEKADRLKHYAPLETSFLFFMIQEMEAWILSQPDKLEEYAVNEGFVRKRVDQNIADDSLIKNKHPEELSQPAKKLNTLFKKYFSITKKSAGVSKEKPKSYSKSKDGPKLIAQLHLGTLMSDFDEAECLVKFINENNL